MSSPVLIVFEEVDLNERKGPEGDDCQLSEELVAGIKNSEGFQKAYYGRKIEVPDVGVIVTRRSILSINP